ncbi:hypothetical protein [Cupriavidus necator]|uniref:hypothetical protein n=1 Tax=Cupriavidus necator TaxID=106590 RepID=UPI000B192A27|nr:hypothetical protein [Cupriavidus necator]
MPLQLQVVTPDGVEAPSGIALAIAGQPVTETPDQRHVSFLLQRTEAWWLVHLAWQNYFACDAITEPRSRAGEYCYVEFDLFDEYNAFVFVEWIFELQANNRHTIPYSIDLSDQPRFDAARNLLPFGVGEGFTCASFVKVVLELYGVKLVDLQYWPTRESDAPWQRYILHRLAGHAPRESIEAQEQLIGTVARLRPEEVVGAASFLSTVPVAERAPVPFATAETAGGQVRGEMVRLNKI